MEGAVRIKRRTCLEQRQPGIMPWLHLKACRSSLSYKAPQLDAKVLCDLGLPASRLSKPLVLSPTTALASSPTKANRTGLEQHGFWASASLYMLILLPGILCPLAELLLNVILDMTSFAQPSYLCFVTPSN